MQKSMFERYLDALEKSADITLQWYFQKQYIKEQLLSEAEIDRIVDRVLERFKVKVDVTEAVLEIDKLKRAIDQLGNGGKYCLPLLILIKE